MIAIAATIAAATAGALLLWWGWCGRQLPCSPRCRRCAYEIVGVGAESPTGRCPECGAALSARGAVRRTMSKRRPVTLVVAAALIAAALGGAFLITAQRGFPAGGIGAVPSWLLLAIEPAADDVTRTELLRRIVAGELGDRAALRYADRLLARRDAIVASGRDPAEFDQTQRITLRAVHKRVVMTDDQLARWVRGAIEPLVGPAPVEPIRVGQLVPIGVRSDATLLGTKQAAWLTLSPMAGPGGTPLSVLPILDIELIEAQSPAAADPIRLGGRASGSADSDLGISTWLDLDLPPGRHEINVRARLSVRLLDVNNPLASWTSTVQVPIEVRPAEGEDAAPIVDVALRPIVRAAVAAEFAPVVELDIGGTQSRFHGSGVVAVVKPIPVPICADVIVRDLIGEHVVGVLRVAADDVGHMTVDREIVARLAPIDGLVDVILRPDPAAARRRFGTARIWGEPIVIEGVVVVRE